MNNKDKERLKELWTRVYISCAVADDYRCFNDTPKRIADEAVEAYINKFKIKIERI